MMPMPGQQPSAMPQMMAPPPMPSEDEIEAAQQIVDACTWEEVSAILRSDDRRNYNVNIETTATSYEDDMEEKSARTEYVTALTQMMQFWGPAMQMNPSLVPFVKELVLFGAGAFKVGRTLEETLEDAFDQIKNTPPQPNPEAEQAKMEMQQAAQEHAQTMQQKQADSQAKQQLAAVQIQREQFKAQADQQSAVTDAQKAQTDMGLRAYEAKIDQMLAMMQMQMKQQEMAHTERMHALDRGTAEHAARVDMSQAVFDANMQRQMAEDERQHQNKLAEDRHRQMARQSQVGE